MTNQEDHLEERLEDIQQNFGPGSVLKAKREEYEWAIESVAQALHLSTTNVRAIESDSYHELPGSTYVMGYWRSYARLLGIDIEETIEANKRNLQVVQPKTSGINVNGGAMPRSDSRKGLVWLALSALILAGLAFAWKSGLLDPQKIIDVTQLQEQAEIAESTSIEGETGVLRKVEEELISKLSVNRNTTEPTTDLTALNVVEQTDEVPAVVNEESLSVNNTQTASPEINGSVVVDSAIAAAESMGMVSEVSANDNKIAGADDIIESEVETPNVASVDKNLLVLKLEKDSWLDVRDKSNKRLVYRSGKAGEVVNLRGEPPFYVYIGTPDGVKVTYLNQNVPFKAHQSGLFARFKLGELLESL